MNLNLILTILTMSGAIALAGWIVGVYLTWLASLVGVRHAWDLVQVTVPAGVLAVMMALACAVPGDYNGNPEKLAAAAHALQIGGMWAACERDPRFPDARTARTQAEEWTGEGLDALATVER